MSGTSKNTSNVRCKRNQAFDSSFITSVRPCFSCLFTIFKEKLIDVMIQINPVHLQLLRPLIKWKILTLENLFEESIYQGTYKTFNKVMRGLEKKGLVQGYRDYFSRKKYIFATELGNELLLKGGKFTPNHHSMFHDTRMVELIRELRLRKNVNEFDLEHVYRDFSYDRSDGGYYPDGVLEVITQADDNVKMAVELELTQKSSTRIQNKYYKFIKDDTFDYVIFFFPEESILKKYVEVFQEHLETQHSDLFIFCHNPHLVKGKINLEDTTGYYNFQYNFNFTNTFGERLI